VEEFGKQFGRLTRRNQQPYTKSRIYQMLRDNSFPKEQSRRWVLAKLLQIPPVLLGVTSLDDLLRHYEQTTVIAPTQTANVPQPFDYTEYKTALRRFWKQHRLNTLITTQNEIRQRIVTLEKEVLYGQAPQKKHFAVLLCGYHMLLSNIAMDQQNSDNAIVHLNHAYVVAKDWELTRFQGGILLRRGWVLKERGEEYASNHQFDKAQADFDFAAKDFAVGLTLVKQLPEAMQGSLILSTGKLDADRATTPFELHQAMRKIDKAQPFVGKKSDEEDIHFIQLDEERYYLDRAAAYLAARNPLICYPGEARRELYTAMAVEKKPTPKRRQAYNMVLESKSYMIEGHAQTQRKKLAAAADAYGQAIEMARKALPLVIAVKSEVNISRIKHLCAEISQTDFGKKSIQLAALEVELVTAKYPLLFQ
jgi:cellobiose-specific phosphotransferase system component IIA